jgi:hypothetical protein
MSIFYVPTYNLIPIVQLNTDKKNLWKHHSNIFEQLKKRVVIKNIQTSNISFSLNLRISSTFLTCSSVNF